MKGLICNTSVRTNEDYRKIVEKRMRLFAGMGLIGAITMVVSFLGEFLWKVSIDERMLGIYSGFGTGIFGISIVFWILNKRLLRNEDKLKESRISSTDERLQEISTRALTVALIVLLAAIYITALIGGLFYPIIVTPLFILVFVFFFSYLIAYLYFKKKM